MPSGDNKCDRCGQWAGSGHASAPGSGEADLVLPSANVNAVERATLLGACDDLAELVEEASDDHDVWADADDAAQILVDGLADYVRRVDPGNSLLDQHRKWAEERQKSTTWRR